MRDEDVVDARCVEYGTTLGEWYDPTRYKWGAEPPPGDICRACYEWRRYPESQRHFGWAWWMRCGYSPMGQFGCDCEHHKTELWLA